MPRARKLPWRTLLAVAALFAVILGLRLIWVQPGDQELADLHSRSLMAAHLTDVASSDQHTVKPWFQGKLDYSPPVIDLAGDHFPLLGGRLEIHDGKAVAVLVYGRRKHVIDLFVWPTTGAANATPSHSQSRGYHALIWRQGEWQFGAVSDLNVEEMDSFVRLLRQKIQ